MDLSLFNFFHSLAGQSGFFDTLIIFLAKYLPYFLGAAFIFFVFRQSGRRQKISAFLFAALTVLLSRGLITEIIRFFYHRPRPFEALGFEPLLLPSTDQAFPSGHAAFFFALAMSLFPFDRKWAWSFLGLALLNSLGRIAAGVHWPSDILGGLAAALISVFIVNRLLKKV